MILPLNKSEQRAQGKIDLDSSSAHSAAHRRLHKAFSDLLADPHALMESFCNEFATLIVEFNKLHAIVVGCSTELQGVSTAVHHAQREHVSLQRHQGRLQQCHRRLSREFIKSFTGHTKYGQILHSCEDLMNSYLKEMVQREGDGLSYTGRAILTADFSHCKFQHEDGK